MMADVGFGQAQALVRADQEDTWRRECSGEFYVAPYGFESPTHWCVIFGAREYLVDDDDMYVLMDAPLTLVSKATGAISHLNYLQNLRTVRAMTKVGPWPQDSLKGPRG